MADTCLQLLVQQAHHVDGPQLLVADENLRGRDLPLFAKKNTALLTNRYDLYQQALNAGLNSYFSDFDFSPFADNNFDQVLYRVSKEKLVTHHIINSAKRVLSNSGYLTLVGEKSDGIKSYTDKAGRYFDDNNHAKSKAKKNGTAYIATIATTTHSATTQPQTSAQQPLDDGDYPQLRPCITIDGKTLLSKPGLFGWNKIDQGSAFLADHLNDFFQMLNQNLGRKPNNILDLGCGYGYLSMMAHQFTTPDISIVATDNNAAAITACTENFSLLGINGEVIVSNCADDIEQQLNVVGFDAVICNPPFHQGFDTNNELTQRFVTSSYRHLISGGMALFVANRFVPIENCAEKFFEITKLAENKSFKVILLKKI